MKKEAVVVMVGERVLDVRYYEGAPRVERVFLQLASRVFCITGGYQEIVPSLPPGGESILPSSAKNLRIEEVVTDCESMALRLEDGSYVFFGWTIDTDLQEGRLDVQYYAASELDQEFLETIEEMRS